MSRIYYFAYVRPKTGGDFLNIEHVMTLQDCGFPAQMVYPGERAQHEELPRNSEPINEILFTKDDYLVIPENEAPLIKAAHGVPSKVVIHNLNTYYFLNAIRSLGELDQEKFDTALCCSRVSAAMLVDSGYRGAVHVIHPGLPDYLSPSKKRLRIAFAPRKLPVESGAVLAAFQQMFPEYAGVEWYPLMNLDRKDLAMVLGESAIYAAFGYLESLSLSILEAMKSGCIVVGDHGGGGAEYATEHNGFWVRASDVTKFSRKLAEAVNLFLQDGANNRITVNAVRTAEKFNSKDFLENLTSFWASRIRN